MTGRIPEILGPNGLLARTVEGFLHRPQQEAMAGRVEATLEAGGVLITEAGTGTGKTFAYLVPALLSGKKVIVSTGTKALQDQLYQRDLPRVRDTLAVPARIALLKGRSNYLCLHRLDNTRDEGQLRSRELLDQLRRIGSWARRTRTGDTGEVSGVPEDSLIWPLVTSTTDNCLGQECPQLKDCHLAEARRRAQEADLVVINHHLLCADFALREGGFGELLPAADAYIIDEAHQLPEVASNFFGLTVSGRQLQELCKDTETEYLREAGDVPAIPDHTRALDKSVRDLRLSFGVDARRGPWTEIERDDSILQALQGTRQALAELGDVLEPLAERGKGVESCGVRARALQADLQAVCDADSGDYIRWYETMRQSFRLNRTPMEIANLFKARMEQHARAWVFTSATLAVGDSFRHFQDQLGIEQCDTARWDSPFDYPNQALWFVPRGMPEPNTDAFQRAVIDLAVEVVTASQGRAFLLFTSHRALRAAAEQLAERVPFPLLIQGDAPKTELLDRFRQLGNAILLGAASFWEGVDVRGEALSCVVIDKLPFASPGDPVLQARIEHMRKSGRNPFVEFQLPQAVISLKQGAGRLIRDVTDRGVLVVCDPRLLSRKSSYGPTFLEAMPPMGRTRELEDVKRFFATPPTEHRTSE